MSVVKSLSEWQEGREPKEGGEGERIGGRAVAQLALDEHVVEDRELEAALEQRLERREVASEARKAFKEAHEKASGEIAKLELPDGGAVRCGRFRITRTAIAPKSVAFETEASSRVNIAVVGE